ncbi:MAG: enoyl-CoA hydratase/isomerase family protein [Gammaproteobacteria bacterium]
MEYETLKLDINYETKIAKILLTRPQAMNAFNEQLVWDLKDATERVSNEEKIRVCVLTGMGRGFSSGADLQERGASWKSTKDSLLNGYLPSLKAIINMPIPVIASINGPAAGIGAAYAMACDLRIMSRDAFIMSVFSNIALVPDGGLAWLLPKGFGYAKALEYAIEAKKISAEECERFGVANKVVDQNDLEAETEAWATNIASRSPTAVRETKKLMRLAMEKGYLEVYKAEAEIQDKIFGGDEFKEGVTAFFEKRKPNFK